MGKGGIDEGDPSQSHTPTPWATQYTNKYAMVVKSIPKSISVAAGIAV